MRQSGALQRPGGVAACAAALMYVFGLALPLGPLTERPATIDEGLLYLLEHRALVTGWNLAIYVAFGVALLVLALALSECLRARASALSSAARAPALVRVALAVAAGMCRVVGLDETGTLLADDAARAVTLWLVVETIADGLGGGIEAVGGPWLMLLGSAWQGNRSERQVVLTTRAVDVDHAEGHWSFTSFAEAAETVGASPFPRRRAPLHESAERIRYFVLNFASGGRPVIPCAECFARFYGVSHHFRQAWLGYLWVSGGRPMNRLYGNPRITLEPDTWAVRLRPRLDDRDAIFLAHAKYDPFTARAAKRPYAKLVASFDPRASAALGTERIKGVLSRARGVAMVR